MHYNASHFQKKTMKHYASCVMLFYLHSKSDGKNNQTVDWCRHYCNRMLLKLIFQAAGGQEAGHWVGYKHGILSFSLSTSVMDGSKCTEFNPLQAAWPRWLGSPNTYGLPRPAPTCPACSENRSRSIKYISLLITIVNWTAVSGSVWWNITDSIHK